MSLSVTEVAKERGIISEFSLNQSARWQISNLFEAISASLQRDATTETLRKVVGSFHEKIKGIERVNSEVWRDKLIGFLHRIIEGQSDPFLGSDGYPYDGKELAVYYSHCPEKKLECSPSTGKSGFFVEPHQALSSCLRWLEDRGVSIENPCEAEYQWLHQRGLILPLPTKANHAMRAIFWKQIERAKRAAEGARFAQAVAEAHVAVAEHERASEIVIQEAEESERKIADLTQAVEAAHAAFMDKSASLHKQNAEIGQRCERLEQATICLGQEIFATKHEIAQLQAILKECEEALEALKEQQSGIQMVRIFCTALSITMSMATGMPWLTAIAIQVKRAVVSIAVSEVVKDPTISAIICGGVNGATEASFAKETIAAATIKGSTLPMVRGVATAAGASSPLAGAITSTVGTTFNGGVSVADYATGAGFGGMSGAISDMTGVAVDVSKDGKKLSVNIKI
ncbi:MAG: hypothetical protein S4CHLAM45_07910 [Chlamydiales bacterium]|nr:hypothetical protein [Chlamydiales bacterium]MCH9619999.1 hypothetical protein [Chlamydiales bacterium]MCH9622897.1 hypothetical protein [Chlamydiales bacterium]